MAEAEAQRVSIWCRLCDQEIPEHRVAAGRDTCGTHKCCRAHRTNRWRDNNIQLPVPTGTVGAVAELLVAADLLKRGYEVFRAVSQACSCDLAVLKNGALLRVEVRTGYFDANGAPFRNKLTAKDVGRSDIHAVVHHYPKGGTLITYSPELPA
jgi:hypothetical protein